LAEVDGQHALERLRLVSGYKPPDGKRLAPAPHRRIYIDPENEIFRVGRRTRADLRRGVRPSVGDLMPLLPAWVECYACQVVQRLEPEILHAGAGPLSEGRKAVLCFAGQRGAYIISAVAKKNGRWV
jgi:hypothetical protein